MTDLFAGGDEEWRDELRALGWSAIPIVGASGTRWHWYDPTGKRHTEDEAFAFIREKETHGDLDS